MGPCQTVQNHVACGAIVIGIVCLSCTGKFVEMPTTTTTTPPGAAAAAAALASSYYTAATTATTAATATTATTATIATTRVGGGFNLQSSHKY